jgi:hypothetical protein
MPTSPRKRGEVTGLLVMSCNGDVIEESVHGLDHWVA